MKDSRKIRKEHFRRGIFILPNIFTTLNMFFGFFAMVNTLNGKYTTAAYAIVIAGVFDLLDGKIARATNTTSPFGMEYDSLADVVSFGLAPALLAYSWSLTALGRIGWLAAFLYAVCGALRLARFNTQAGTVDSGSFVGLPIPGGAGMIATTVLFCHRIGVGQTVHPLIILVMIYGLSFLMVSTIRFNSFKQPELFHKIKFNLFVITILILVFIAAEPAITLFIMGFFYTLSGPLIFFMGLRKPGRLEVDSKEIP
jgi:CDP-diacylglycerol--serine O-phosphatidyltransferase